jgi:hypothetical protein
MPTWLAAVIAAASALITADLLRTFPRGHGRHRR